MTDQKLAATVPAASVTLLVLSYKGTAPARPIACEFDLKGGTIGRADNNKLILPDPMVSRVHGQIVNRQGVFVIISRGRNPLLVDEVPVQAGDELPLRDGTRVQIGEFLMQTSLAMATFDEGAAHMAARERRKEVGESFGGL